MNLMNVKLRNLSLSLLAYALCSCAGSFHSQLNFNPSEPIRVVVLPFAQVDSQGAPIEEKSDLVIDQVGLVSSELGEKPSEFIRKLVQNELSKSALDVVSPALVDSRLSHTGFAKPDLSPDLLKLYSTRAQDICPAVLDCDAVMYGRISEWDRSYYAIQSVSSVGFELKLVSARDGKVLFESKVADSDSRGLTKGPTGFSDLVIEPIRGLNSEIIADLSRGLVRKTLDPFYIKNRPEFLDLPAPAIFASAHDAVDGNIQRSLKVVLLGSSGLNASFSIGNLVQHRPMAERDAGHYIGEYFPLENDEFKDQMVTVYLTDRFGRTTEQILARQKVSLLLHSPSIAVARVSH